MTTVSQIPFAAVSFSLQETPSGLLRAELGLNLTQKNKIPIKAPARMRPGIMPKAAEEATEEPEMAENPAMAAIVAIPRPPGSLRSHLSNVLYRSLLIPE